MYLQHVSIPRPPGPESRKQAQEFFGRLLALAEKPVPRSIQHLDLIWFQVGESELHCFAEEPQDDRSGRHFCLVTEDVEGTRQKLLAAGYEPWNPEAIPGRPRFFCRDPFGNIIEFTTITADYLAVEKSNS
jgi:catechol 2,3-dioxygenase-like lactoylglutathione lyase family enzyme